MTQADWKSDPLRRHSLRYWDGRGWTGHVSDGDETSWDDEGLSALSSVSTPDSAPAKSTRKVSVAAVVIAWFLTVTFGRFAIPQWSSFIGGSSFFWPLDVVGVLIWTALFAAGVYASVRVTAQFAAGDKSKLLGALAATGAVLAGYFGAASLIQATLGLAYGVQYAFRRGLPGVILVLAAFGLGWFAFRVLDGGDRRKVVGLAFVAGAGLLGLTGLSALRSGFDALQYDHGEPTFVAGRVAMGAVFLAFAVLAGWLAHRTRSTGGSSPGDVSAHVEPAD